MKTNTQAMVFTGMAAAFILCMGCAAEKAKSPVDDTLVAVEDNSGGMDDAVPDTTMPDSGTETEGMSDEDENPDISDDISESKDMDEETDDGAEENDLSVSDEDGESSDLLVVDEAPDNDAYEPPSAIKIVVVSDTHFSGDEEKIDRMQKIISAINKQKGDLAAVDALVITGDIVSKIYPDWPDTTESHIDVALSVLASLSVPYYLVLGNHDYNLGDHDTNWGAVFTEQEILEAETVWLEKAALQPYFSVILKGWKLIFLNSMRGYYLQRNFDDAQLAWFEAELAEGMPSLLFFHHPIETDTFQVWAGPNENIPKFLCNFQFVG